MPTSKLPEDYITKAAHSQLGPFGRVLRKPVRVWHELLILLVSGLTAATIMVERGNISLGAEWGSATRIVALRLTGVVARTDAPDVGLYEGPPGAPIEDERMWVRGSEATVEQLAAHRLQFEETYKIINEQADRPVEAPILNWDGSIDAFFDWENIFYCTSGNWAQLSSLWLLLFLLMSSSIGFRSDIGEHCQSSWLAAYTLREGLESELFELKNTETPSNEMRGVRFRAVITPPLVFALWFVGLSSIANKFRF